MEASILKEFIRRNVAILVGGVWIEGHLLPIVKNIVTLTPIGLAKEHFGPTACKMEVIQAIREVKNSPAQQVSIVNQDTSAPAPIQSAFATQQHPGNRFVHK
jgi:hypothetical protein